MQALMERVAFKPVSTIQVKPRWQLDPDLLIYLPLWNMPDGQTYLSQDAYGHTVTRTGATPTGQGAWSFDGTDDSATVANNSAFNLADNLTLVVWTLITSLPTEYPQIWGRGNFSGGNKLGYQLTHSNGVAEFRFYMGDGTNDYGVNTWYTYTTGQWNQFAASFLRPTAYVYINGVQQATTITMDAAISNYDNTPALFNDIVRGTWLAGRCGEASLYKRALSALEIHNLWNETRGRYGGG